MTSLRTGLLLAAVALVVAAPAFATRNAPANGEWISFGVPTRINVGSTGPFYMMGNDMGAARRRRRCTSGPTWSRRTGKSFTPWSSWPRRTSVRSSASWPRGAARTRCGSPTARCLSSAQALRNRAHEVGLDGRAKPAVPSVPMLAFVPELIDLDARQGKRGCKDRELQIRGDVCARRAGTVATTSVRLATNALVTKLATRR